ncbi:unnamed protein product, partial [Allacma fusca]
DNDIALVKLSRPLKWSPTVAPVCLPNDDEQTLAFNMTGVKCVATGWGMNSPRGKLSSKMQQVGRVLIILYLSQVIKHKWDLESREEIELMIYSCFNNITCFLEVTKGFMTS